MLPCQFLISSHIWPKGRVSNFIHFFLRQLCVDWQLIIFFFLESNLNLLLELLIILNDAITIAQYIEKMRNGHGMKSKWRHLQSHVIFRSTDCGSNCLVNSILNCCSRIYKPAPSFFFIFIENFLIRGWRNIWRCYYLLFRMKNTVVLQYCCFTATLSSIGWKYPLQCIIGKTMAVPREILFLGQFLHFAGKSYAGTVCRLWSNCLKDRSAMLWQVIAYWKYLVILKNHGHLCVCFCLVHVF